MEKLAIIDINRHVLRVIVGTVSQTAYSILYEKKNRLRYNHSRSEIKYRTITSSQQKCIITALLAEKQKLEQNGVRFIVATATSFLREAYNAHAIVTVIRQETDMHVEIISNQEEVQSIYFGMDPRLKSHRKSHLLLDPNGKSMEFVLFKGTYAYLEDSHPLCMRRLVARFPHKDPIAPREIELARQYFRLFCCCLFRLHGGCTVSKLMSSSGIFHTLFELHKQVNAQPKVAYYPNMKRMSVKQFHRTYKAVLKTPSDTWLKDKAIDPFFLPLMPLSVIFLDALIRHCEIGEIVIPSHSPQTGLFVHLWQKFKKYRLFE